MPVDKSRRSGSKGPGDHKSGPRQGGRKPNPRRDQSQNDGLAGPAKWGRVARRGAGGLGEDDQDRQGRDGRDGKDTKGGPVRQGGGRPREDAESARPSHPRPDRKLPDGEDLRRSASKAVDRGRKPSSKSRRPLPPRPHSVVEPKIALRALVGEERARRLARRLDDAGRAFAAERFDESRKVLVPIVKEAPDLPEARELLGLSFYRMGKWKDAISHLEVFRELSGSTEQHPVLADCHRALGHWRDVEFLWSELGEASPSSALVIEGRIVLAGAKADQGDVVGAISILEDGWRLPKKPRLHHLRRAYALADLYERAGRTPRARQLFGWVAKKDPELADVAARVRSLS